MRLAVTGSSKGVSYSAVAHALDEAVHGGAQIECLLVGACGAVDALVARWAAINRVPLRRVQPEDKHAHAPQMGRIIALAERSSAAIVLWDGQSQGTQLFLDHAARAGTPVALCTLQGEPWPDNTLQQQAIP